MRLLTDTRHGACPWKTPSHWQTTFSSHPESNHNNYRKELRRNTVNSGLHLCVASKKYYTYHLCVASKKDYTCVIMHQWNTKTRKQQPCLHLKLQAASLNDVPAYATVFVSFSSRLLKNIAHMKYVVVQADHAITSPRPTLQHIASMKYLT
jgi:hypothetical protein